MNETIYRDGASDVPWPTSDHRARLPDTSMPQRGEKVAPAVAGLPNQAAQGAHDTLDRLADRAAPAAQQFGERVSAAEDALHAKTDPLRDTRDIWVDRVRSAVRGKPLASFAAAVALGALIARLAR